MGFFGFFLGKWDFGNEGILKCGILRMWDLGILGKWDFGIVGFFESGIFLK